MGIVRKYAIQGHAVPKGYQRPLGPFPAEILAANPRAHEEHRSDSLHEALDDIRMFRCKECADVLYQDELAYHDCEYEE
jgi:hypothetical protein